MNLQNGKLGLLIVQRKPDTHVLLGHVAMMHGTLPFGNVLNCALHTIVKYILYYVVLEFSQREAFLYYMTDCSVHRM